MKIEQGRVVIDDDFRTMVSGVYAIGDLVRGPMLAHKASEEGVAVAEIVAGKPGHVNYNTIPNVVYTHPELAQVGITEEEAKAKNVPYKVGKYFYKANGRAKSLGAEDGRRVRETHRPQGDGSAAWCPHRWSESVRAHRRAGPGMEFQAAAEDVARTTHAHPSLSEMVKEAALAVDRMAIHG